MLAIGAFIRCASTYCVLSCGLMVACTAPKERETIVSPPVAGPTSTPTQDTPSPADSGSPAVNQPDVPFDGGQPEAVGTALPPAVGEPGLPSSAGASFDIYAELWKGAVVCAEDKL
ncbi:MAG: hypothetical protein RLZZ488_1266 [Pseudomonadota bacterium]|jgi:hypothetical protein